VIYSANTSDLEDDPDLVPVNVEALLQQQWHKLRTIQDPYEWCCGPHTVDIVSRRLSRPAKPASDVELAQSLCQPTNCVLLYQEYFTMAWLRGIVKEVVSGDTVVVVAATQGTAVPAEKRLTLSSLIAPRLVRLDPVVSWASFSS
jgi:hypothetical protein